MRIAKLGILFAFFAVTLVAHAMAAGGKSDSKVKAKASAGKVGDDGKQIVTITLDIEKGWHLYANPVNHNNDFLNSNKTTVKIAAKTPLKSARVIYPEGKVKKDGQESYDVYVDSVKIQVEVVRAKGDSSPLEIGITVFACDNSVCLAKGEVKLTAP